MLGHYTIQIVMQSLIEATVIGAIQTSQAITHGGYWRNTVLGQYRQAKQSLMEATGGILC